MTPSAQFHEGHLTVSQVMAGKPVTVPRATSLLEVAEIMSTNRYRYMLISDNDGNLAGVISSNDLLRHMAEVQDEPGDWKTIPVESIMTTKFVASRPGADADDIKPMLAQGSIECVPVLEGDKLVGVLTPNDLLLSCRRLDPMLREASTDALTSLANRATFNTRFEDEWERARRQAAPLAMIIIDVDHFKHVNDSCGHLAGDGVLQMVGACLKRQLRTYDVVARYGGDEFAAICYDCPRENIDVPVRRLQRAVRNLSVPSDLGRRGITLSIGASVIPSGFDDCSPKHLIAAADACLYKAKREGRDRAFLAEIDDPAQQPHADEMHLIREEAEATVPG